MRFLFFLSFIFCLNAFHSQDLDFKILRSINNPERPNWDRAMRHVSFSVYPVMPATVVGIWSHGYFTKDETMMRNGYKSIISISLASAVTTSLKYAFHRTRPATKYPNELTLRDWHIGPLSFPSGHTTVAFSTATALSMSYKKWYVTLPSFLYAGFVGYSRMRLGAHYPSDVLGGIIVGIGAGLMTWQLDKTINGK